MKLFLEVSGMLGMALMGIFLILERNNASHVLLAAWCLWFLLSFVLVAQEYSRVHK
jgi:4-amino-4-deoxy-L-arabinose transferase-like glycosyltransferase